MDKTARRESILHGGIQVLATKGLGGLTHRAVDQQANLPQGSSSYYFPKKVNLLIAVSEFLAAQLEEDCVELQVAFSQLTAEHGLDAAKDLFVQELLDYLGTSRHLFLARIELTLAAAHNPELVGVGEKLTTAARRPIAFFLKLISNGKEDGPIETCSGLIDGITLMHAIGQGPKPTADQISAVFHSLL
ncbi:TetR/AcrR family transcriptional regulator [Pseudovibrio denitrificans]|uniref:TetR/AcrR family transcriptional regulator n=1 Tax=Pseudovibrio denitrificans TaxID=258256 RepID=UPI0039BFDF69